jgi:hypothetical protein
MKSKVYAVFLIAAVLALAPAFGGVVYEIEVTDHEQSPPKSESIEAAVEGRHLKMGIASGGRGAQGEMIFRGDRREMVVVDHEDGSYYVMDEATMKQLAGQVSGAMGQMQEALKNVPEDKRKMMEEMMKQRLPQQAPERPKSELRETGERGSKNGYPCVKYEVLRDGRKIREVWVTDWSNVEGGSDVVDAFEDMADFFKELMDSIPDFGQGGPSGDPVFEHMRELGGFPVVTREFDDDDGSLEGESVLESVAERDLDPDAFEPPKGYRLRTMGPQ